MAIDDDDDDDDLEAYPESMLDSVIRRASDMEGGTENPFLLQQQQRKTIFSSVINNQDGDDLRPSNSGRTSRMDMRPSASDIENEAAVFRTSIGGGGGERLSKLRPSLVRAASSEVMQLKLRQQKQQQQQQQLRRQMYQRKSEVDAAAIAAEEVSLGIDEDAAAVVDVGAENANEDDGAAAAAAAEEGEAAALAEPEATAAAEAAEAWTSHLDPSSDRVYWHNATTGETTWDEPEGLAGMTLL